MGKPEKEKSVVDGVGTIDLEAHVKADTATAAAAASGGGCCCWK